MRILVPVLLLLAGLLGGYWIGRTEQSQRTAEAWSLYEQAALERDQAVRIMDRHGPKFPIAQKPTFHAN